MVDAPHEDAVKREGNKRGNSGEQRASGKVEKSNPSQPASKPHPISTTLPAQPPPLAQLPPPTPP